MDRHTYQRYLRSPSWKARAARIRTRAQGQCEGQIPDPSDYKLHLDTMRCLHTTDLQVHHKHYDTVGEEQDADLICLCDRCHQLAHIMQQECESCSFPVFEHVVDAMDYLEHQRSLGDDLEQILASMPMCDHCEYMWNKND